MYALQRSAFLLPESVSLMGWGFVVSLIGFGIVAGLLNRMWRASKARVDEHRLAERR